MKALLHLAKSFWVKSKYVNVRAWKKELLIFTKRALNYALLCSSNVGITESRLVY